MLAGQRTSGWLEGGGSRGRGSSSGWQTDRGEREPTKLDYSCCATLNGVTHVRDYSARGGLLHHVVAGTRSIPFQSNERTDGAALYKVRKFQFNLFLARLLIEDRHGAHEVSRRVTFHYMLVKAFASLRPRTTTTTTIAKFHVITIIISGSVTELINYG